MANKNEKIIEVLSRMSGEELMQFLAEHNRIKGICDLSEFNDDPRLIYAFLTCGYGYIHEVTLTNERRPYMITDKNCPKSYNEFLKLFNKYNEPAVCIASFNKEDTNRYSISVIPHIPNRLAFYNDDDGIKQAVDELLSAITATYNRIEA